MAFETLPMLPLPNFFKVSEIESVSARAPSSISGSTESGTLASTGYSSSSSIMPIQLQQTKDTHKN